MIEVEMAATGSLGVLQGRSLRTTVLVDSGADVTMLDGGLATTLGLDLTDARYPRDVVGGVGSGGVPVATALVKMSLCGRWVDVPVNFTLQPMTNPPLLGRAGAFDALVISFLHRQRVVLGAAA